MKQAKPILNYWFHVDFLYVRLNRVSDSLNNDFTFLKESILTLGMSFKNIFLLFSVLLVFVLHEINTFNFVCCRSRRQSAFASTWSAIARTAMPSSGWFSSNPESTGWPATTRPAQCCHPTGSTNPAPLQLLSHKMSIVKIVCLKMKHPGFNKWSWKQNQESFWLLFAGQRGSTPCWPRKTADLCPSYSGPIAVQIGIKIQNLKIFLNGLFNFPTKFCVFINDSEVDCFAPKVILCFLFFVDFKVLYISFYF